MTRVHSQPQDVACDRSGQTQIEVRLAFAKRDPGEGPIGIALDLTRGEPVVVIPAKPIGRNEVIVHVQVASVLDTELQVVNRPVSRRPCT